ncbi:MAG: periplasmic protein involved in polysaccharide export [Caulobacteraceae bacterium]|nr:periplasmic protein involved in polysaccharide export [Caulobacteraceae bacterium]
MIFKRRLSAVAAFFCVLAMASCATPTPLETLPTMDPDVQSVISAYKLGPGDKIRVNTFGEASLSGEFQINPAGVVAFPLIGDVPASGLTSSTLQDRLMERLRDGYLLNPRVNVEILSYRPFYILGEVNQPASYPYSSGLTVNNAVATANGFTYRADSRRVFIKHADDAEEKEYRLTSSTQVAPGDTIRIAERYF